MKEPPAPAVATTLRFESSPIPKTNPSAAQPSAQSVTWRGILARLGVCSGTALLLYAGIVAGLIEPYVRDGSSAGRVAGVYEGYSSIQRHRLNTRDSNSLVLFWGSSMVREGVDCAQLEAGLPAVSAYNFAVSGDLPCRRLVELPRAKELNPQRVVIGLSYPEVFEDRLPFEDQIAVLPATAYAAMPPAAEQLLPVKFHQMASRPEWDRFLWKRKFFLPAVFSRVGVGGRGDQLRPGHATEFKAPWVYVQGIRTEELKRFLTLRKNAYPPYTSGPLGDPASTLAARSLALLVRELVEQGTEVMLVNMPLHPMLGAIVPAERRAALNHFLATLRSERVSVLDYQDRIPASGFVDLVHMNAEGRVAFTQLVSEVLAVPHQTAPAKNYTQAQHAL